MTQTLGLAVCRYLLGLDPIASADPVTLERAMRDAIRLHLTRPMHDDADEPLQQRQFLLVGFPLLAWLWLLHLIFEPSDPRAHENTPSCASADEHEVLDASLIEYGAYDCAPTLVRMIHHTHPALSRFRLQLGLTRFARRVSRQLMDPTMPDKESVRANMSAAMSDSPIETS